VKTISEQVIADLQLENKLITEYTKLIAGAKIDYRGQVYNLSGLITLQMSTNRETRKEVDQLRAQFFLEQSTQLDRIYDDLVQVRAQIAHKLGYQNFVQLGYDRMYRKDYGPIDIANYRQAISEQVVPLATELRLAQSKRIGTPELYYYDESVYFVHGNPKPTGSITQILEAASQMYSELSAETGKFFEFMSSNELLDLLNRPNKRGGGYCTFIPQLKAPFIFANFNGTEGDITVLTHEAGHAFQAYMSRDTDLPEYVFPTYEAAEIHSMSMEFLTWPWMDLFFGDQTRDFKYMHLTKALLFLPYGAAVDEFQHQVYEQPQLTALARKQLWRDLEHKYLPHRQYGANEFLASGGLWQSQSHIFQSPFYYIDYTLAQICALQFWSKAQTAPKQAWQDYLALCRVGGSKSFSELIAITGLESPFSHASIANVLLTTQNWIDSSLIN
jgi:M3 family oligoendopeptidase